VEFIIRPLAGYFGAEVTRPLARVVFALCFALFFAGAIRRLIRRAATSEN